MNNEATQILGPFSDGETDDADSKLKKDARSKEPSWNETSPRACSKKYEILGSASTGLQEYGRGVWSVVYRANEVPESYQSPPLTPPTSPTYRIIQPGIVGTLAVKAPCRRDAHKILEKEARVLTYLHSFLNATEYLVPFHGFDQAKHSIVLSAISLSLETYSKTGAENARVKFSTRTMCDPVIGTRNWLQLASQLISGLVFLRSKNCVHGDIKPANILLHDTGSEFPTPLFCDFSSSSVHSPSSLDALCSGLEEIEEVSAVTPDFTSPELLDALYRHSNTMRAIATPASDVFALAVTLAVAAIGESPYASARMEVQKLGMAREGHPLDFARGGENSSRIMKGRLVDKILKPAVEKDAQKRLSADEWRVALDAVLEDRRIAEKEKEAQS